VIAAPAFTLRPLLALLPFLPSILRHVGNQYFLAGPRGIAQPGRLRASSSVSRISIASARHPSWAFDRCRPQTPMVIPETGPSIHWCVIFCF